MHGILQLFQRAWADDRRRDRRIVQQPGQRHGARLLAEFTAEPLVALELGAVPVHLLDEIDVHAPASLRLAQRAAQQAAGQRAPWDQAQSVVATGGNHFELDHAVVEVVDALLAHQAGRPAPGCFLAGRGNVPAGEVARPHVDDLALLHQGVEALPRFVPRARAIDVVHLIEVDPVGPQASQAAFAVLPDLDGREAAAIGIGLGQVAFARHRVVDLGGKKHRVATATALREPAADDFLGRAVLHRPAVDVGRVEEVDAELQGTIHDLEAVSFTGDPTEVHGAQAQVAHQCAVRAEALVLHRHPAVSFRHQEPPAATGR